MRHRSTIIAFTTSAWVGGLACGRLVASVDASIVSDAPDIGSASDDAALDSPGCDDSALYFECGPYTCDSRKSFCLVEPFQPQGAWYCQGNLGCHTCACLKGDAGYPELLCLDPTAPATCSQTGCGLTVVQDC